MKRIITILALVVLVVGGLSVPAFSADTGVVTVTADVVQVSVTVTPSSVSYGLVPMNTTNLAPVGDPSILAQNSGNCFVDMFIRGADTEDWELGSPAGVNIYVHKFGLGFPTPVYTALTDSNQDLGPFSSYSPGSANIFKLQMDTPTVSAATGTQSTTVTVMVTMVTEGLSLILTTDSETYTEGTESAILTASVTDEHGVPVPGLLTGNFFTRIFPPGFPGPGISPIVPTTSWVEDGDGTYTGTMTISALTPGSYTVSVGTNDGASTAVGGDTFNITAP